MKQKGKSINILLLGVGGNVSQGILKALRYSDIPMKIIGACVSPYSSGLYMCDESFICPFAADKEFINWVIDISNKKDIDIIFTGVEENILVLSENIETLKRKTKAVFISSPFNMIQLGQDKLATCKWLKENNCNYPMFARALEKDKVAALIKSVGFPLIAKPIHGKSAKGVVVVNSYKDLQRIDLTKEYVIEEYLPNESGEFTVGCYCDKFSNLKSVITMQRIIKNGTTVYAKVINDNEIESEAKNICLAFKPVGPLNIQMRKNKDGKPVCFELNVRFSGTTAMRSRFGFKDVEAMLNEYVLDKPIDNCFAIRSGESFRYDNELYVYDDLTETMKNNRYLCPDFNDQIVFDNVLSKRNNR